MSAGLQIVLPRAVLEMAAVSRPKSERLLQVS
jgi:hypothetical protein